ncbi:MAG: serine phosphatase [Bryobacterales bacterium]|nr:serine phosphatase [Bryobacterales bacterium]
MPDLQILSPDGKSQVIALQTQRITLGRSTASDLSFPDDNGLSRQHLAIEPDGDGWVVSDLASKNGTILNGNRVTGKTALKPGDRVMAGHLILVYDSSTLRQSRPVVIFDPNEDDGEVITSSSTVITDLAGAIRTDQSVDPQGAAAAQISALVRAGNELAGHRPLPELFNFILELAIGAVKADRGVLMTIEEDGELLVRSNKGEGFHISTAVRDRVLTTGSSVLVRDTSIDDAFRERRSIVEQNIRTLMAVPLQTRDQIIGIIYVDSPSLVRQFTRDDLNLLTVMANVAAIRIEHTRFAEMEQARKLMARDLEQAAEIQRQFLPATAPPVGGLDLAGHNAPCRTVGGDYFDFFPYDGNRVAMVLGDVSGKGMPASLLMMGLQARVQVLAEEPRDLAEVMSKLNRITSANCPSNRFITLFFCILDGDTGELTYCNAGHNPPIIVRADGSRELVPGGGPVIGILASVEYHALKTRLEHGDTLVIYSDGITEAADVTGEEFETDRLGKAVAKCRDLPAGAIVEEVNRAVSEFTAGVPQGDDITMIVARRL